MTDHAAREAAGVRQAARDSVRQNGRDRLPATRADIGPPSRLRRWLLVGLALAVLVAAGITAAVLIGPASQSASESAPGPAAAQLPAPIVPDLASPEPTLADDAGDEPTPDPAVLAGLLSTALADPRLGARLLGHVVDVADGGVLFDAGGAVPGIPASNVKVVTAFAVLSTLDPGDRLTTQVVAGAEPGQIVLVGGGDSTLLRTASSPSYPEAATVADLAQAVQAAAGRPTTSIVVDGSLYSGPSVAPGWRLGDAPSTYAAPITAAMVDGGRVAPGSSSRSATPDLDAGAALAAALGVPGVPVVAGLAPPGARVLGKVSSAPISRLVETMLALSDNVLAESLARQVALARGQSADFAGAAVAVADAVAAAGLDTTGLSLVDGSGLAMGNAVPPQLLTELLREVAAEDGDPDLTPIASGLPVAGYDGTLVDRYAGGRAVGAGSVRAKTGTLDGVNALAGYVVTAEGRLLAFALIADRLPPGPLIGAEPVLDAMAGILASCGCR